MAGSRVADRTEVFRLREDGGGRRLESAITTKLNGEIELDTLGLWVTYSDVQKMKSYCPVMICG